MGAKSGDNLSKYYLILQIVFNFDFVLYHKF